MAAEQIITELMEPVIDRAGCNCDACSNSASAPPSLLLRLQQWLGRN